MGRAYPEAPDDSVAVGDLAPCPLTTVDVRGLESVVEEGADLEMDGRAAADLRRVRSIASTCKAPRSGAESEEVGHPRHHTKAIAIAMPCAKPSASHEDPIAAILSVEPGKVLYRGKVVDVERRATEGLLRGRTRSTARTSTRARPGAQLPERMDRGLGSTRNPSPCRPT